MSNLFGRGGFADFRDAAAGGTPKAADAGFSPAGSRIA